jgi:molybdenum cofactor synthesis domain-containing protein
MMKVAIITANTAIYKGMEENKTGEIVKGIMEDAEQEVVFMRALPMDRKVLSTIMQRMADANLADLILTTGGCGCGPEECMPESTYDIIEKTVPGIPEALRAYMMTLTKRSMLNRCTAGIRNGVLIVNLPGKPQAVEASLKYIQQEIIHAVKVIKGEV